MTEWSVVYKKAINEDGSLLFPERLTQEFLAAQRQSMGSYIFANQYMNEIIPEEEQVFRKEWLRYFFDLPPKVNSFGFIDPAISEADTADYTGIVVVSCDTDKNWYVRYATRRRMNPSELISQCFELCDRFKLMALGIEDVAFQRAILHFAHEEMRRRDKMIPITGVKRGTDKTKEMRILSLVPRFEWGTLYLAQSLYDLELELAEFPRGAHDDLLDALSSIDQIAVYPQKERPKHVAPTPNDPAYEAWYIRNLYKRSNAPDGG